MHPSNQNRYNTKKTLYFLTYMRISIATKGEAIDIIIVQLQSVNHSDNRSSESLNVTFN